MRIQLYFVDFISTVNTLLQYVCIFVDCNIHSGYLPRVVANIRSLDEN